MFVSSKHPVVNTGREKNCNVFTTEPARPQRPSKLNNHISSDQQQKMQLAWKKINVLRCLIVCIRIALQIKLAQLLSSCLMKEEIANRKIASLQTLVNRIGHNDRLCDLRYIGSTAVTEFILLISEHLSNHTVFAVKKSLCWATMVDDITDIATF